MPGLRRLRAAGCGLAIIIVLLVLPSLAGAATLTADAPGRVVAGEPFTVVLTVTNHDQADLEDVAVRAVPKDGVDLVGSTVQPGSCAPDPSTCAVATVPVDRSWSPSFTFIAREGTVPPGTPFQIVFVPTIGGVEGDAVQVEATLLIPGPTTLEVAGAPRQAGPLAPGDDLTYDFTVSNTGTTAAAGVSIEADLPAGVTMTQGGCSDDGHGVLTCPVGALRPGDSVKRTVTLDTSQLTQAGAIRITARDAALDSVSADVPLIVVPFGPADVVLTFLDSPDPMLEDGPLRLTAKLENTSTERTARDVVTTVQLPAGTTIDGLDPGCVAAAASVTCTAASLVPGAKVAYTIILHVPAAPADPKLTSSATTTVASGDPDTTDNASTRQTTVQTVLALARAIAADPAQVVDAALLVRPGTAPASLVSSDKQLGFPMNGGDYALLTTGDASLIDHSVADRASLDSGEGRVGGAYDATVLRIGLDVPADANCLRFDLRVLTEELSTVRPKPDTFVAELDPPLGQPQWTAGPESALVTGHDFATFAGGAPLAVTAPDPVADFGPSPLGTVYDHGSARLRARTEITPGRHVLVLSLFDVGTGLDDTAALIDRLELEHVADGACTRGLSQTPPEASIPARTTVGESEASAPITVTLSRSMPGPTEVTLRATARTATPGEDYDARARTVTIRANKTTATTYWPIFEDSLREGDEDFTVTATSAVAEIKVGTGIVTITDDDGIPALYLDEPKPVVEGGGGTTAVPVVLRLEGKSSTPVSVRIRTVDLTARADDGDYVAIASQVKTIPAGKSQTQVLVRVNGDGRREPDERLEVIADQPNGLTIADDTATVTITNDDTDVPVTTKRKPLRLTATATAKKVKRGASAGYRIWVRNPNTQPVRLRSLSACLPAGFTYAKRSGQGVLRGVPKRGRCGKTGVLLTWRRTVTIPAGTTLKTRFGVRVGKRRGVFRISLSGTAQRPWTVRRSGPVARVRVH